MYADFMGVACDISGPKDVEKLANFAFKEFGSFSVKIELHIPVMKHISSVLKLSGELLYKSV